MVLCSDPVQALCSLSLQRLDISDNRLGVGGAAAVTPALMALALSQHSREWADAALGRVSRAGLQQQDPWSGGGGGSGRDDDDDEEEDIVAREFVQAALECQRRYIQGAPPN